MVLGPFDPVLVPCFPLLRPCSLPCVSFHVPSRPSSLSMDPQPVMSRLVSSPVCLCQARLIVLRSVVSCFTVKVLQPLFSVFSFAPLALLCLIHLCCVSHVFSVPSSFPLYLSLCFPQSTIVFSLIHGCVFHRVFLRMFRFRICSLV